MTSKADLIVHPVRLRILQALTLEKLTTQHIAERLSGVPKSSIYRHLKILLEGGMIDVAETRQVKAIEEKVYQLAQAPRLGPGDLADVTPDEHLRYFISFIATLLQEFAEYLDADSEVDFVADRVGYTQVTFYASAKEVDRFAKTINEALLPLMKNKRGGRRRLRKLASISYPLIKSKGDEND